MDEPRYHSNDQDTARRDLPIYDRLHYAHRANMRAYLLFGVVALMCGLAFPVAERTPASTKSASATKNALPQATQQAPAPAPQIYFHELQADDGRAPRALPPNEADAGMLDAVQRRINAVQNAAPGSIMPIPIELVTEDRPAPHISVEAAQRQAASVAAGRGLSIEAVRQLVSASVQTRRGDRQQVNLLALNLTLDLAATSVH
jgi:hypothetical protein